MKIKFFMLAIIALMMASSFSIRAEPVKSNLDGMKPYIPTRLEWLAVELNSNYRIDMNDLEGYMLNFIPLEAENAILIYVGYNRQTHREAMNIGIDGARKLIERTAKSRGWNSWLKIKEKIELIERRK